MGLKYMTRNHIGFALTFLLMAAGAACAQNAGEAAKPSAPTAASPAATSNCAPLETRTANAPHQKPAFPGQTRVCAVKSDVAFDVTVLAKGLDRPWAVEPLFCNDTATTEK